VTIGGEREATAVKDIADIDGAPTVGTEGRLVIKTGKQSLTIICTVQIGLTWI
jgi:hypothetical protein